MMYDILDPVDDFCLLVDIRMEYDDGFFTLGDVESLDGPDYDARRGLSRLVAAGYLERKLKSYRLTESGIEETELTPVEASQ